MTGVVAFIFPVPDSPAELELLAGEDGGSPVEFVRVDAPALLLGRLVVLGDDGVGEDEVVLALVLLEHVERHAGVEDVCVGEGGLLCDLLDADVLFGLEQEVDDDLGPVGSIAEQAQIGERLLGTAELVLALGELVGEFDEKLAIASALVLRQGQDAGDVVVLGGFLLLGEIAQEMASEIVALYHAVVEKGIDVVVERLVVEEALAEQAEVAAPRLLAATVDLEEGDVFVAVDLVAGRMRERALAAVTAEGDGRRKVGEAHLADVERVDVGVLERIGAKVPSFDLGLAHLDLVEVLDAGDFGDGLGHGARGAKLFDLLLLAKGIARLIGVERGGEAAVLVRGHVVPLLLVVATEHFDGDDGAVLVVLAVGVGVCVGIDGVGACAVWGGGVAGAELPLVLRRLEVRVVEHVLGCLSGCLLEQVGGASGSVALGCGGEGRGRCGGAAGGADDFTLGLVVGGLLFGPLEFARGDEARAADPLVEALVEFAVVDVVLELLLEGGCWLACELRLLLFGEARLGLFPDGEDLCLALLHVARDDVGLLNKGFAADDHILETIRSGGADLRAFVGTRRARSSGSAAG